MKDKPLSFESSFTTAVNAVTVKARKDKSSIRATVLAQVRGMILSARYCRSRQSTARLTRRSASLIRGALRLSYTSPRFVTDSLISRHGAA